jgi:hypothetical protein
MFTRIAKNVKDTDVNWNCGCFKGILDVALKFPLSEIFLKSAAPRKDAVI